VLPICGPGRCTGRWRLAACSRWRSSLVGVSGAACEGSLFQSARFFWFLC